MLSCASLSRRKRPERFEARREEVLKSTESRRSNRLLIAATEADFLVFLKVFGCWRRLQLRNRRARYAPGKSKVFLPIHRSHCRDSLHTMSHWPDASEQHEMRIAGEWKIDQIGKSFGASFSRDGG